MKKLMILFLVPLFVLLVGCTGHDISKILFIASVGIEKEEDEYHGYFYLPLSSDIGKTETSENKGKGQFAKTTGKTIPELFYNIQASTSLNINFKHVSSIVLNMELLNDEFLVQLLDFIKYSLLIDFNCYVFATTEKLEELYDFQNPNEESVLNSLLVSTSDISTLFLVASPVHFLKFTREFYLNRSILIPALVLEELWTIDSEKVKNFHVQTAVYYYNDKIKKVEKNPSSPYFSKATEFIDKINDTSMNIKCYSMTVDYKRLLQVKVEFSYELYKSDNHISEEEIKAFVHKRIEDYIIEYQEFDPLNLDYFNSVYKNSCTYDTMDIQVVIKKN
ncbi:MAG: hypothetical protein K2N64_03700 [Anaeroplasmataceae bacterium]|nr:hypothetical protein [Anaeroplasmataceae bacterium]